MTENSEKSESLALDDAVAAQAYKSDANAKSTLTPANKALPQNEINLTAEKSLTVLSSKPFIHRREDIPKIKGEPIIKLPDDLYIPPDALSVFLEAFSGPLDLLLYLIKKNNIDILDIPICSITEQYIEYVEFIKGIHLTLAADYLVMAAMLAEIKSRLLLPRPVSEEDEEFEDPRDALVKRLLAYEQFKLAANSLDELPRAGRETFNFHVKPPKADVVPPLPQVQLPELLMALKEVMLRADNFSAHHVTREPLSVRERMSQVLAAVPQQGFVAFDELFVVDEGRAGVVVTFLAILELQKNFLICIVQNELFAPIYIQAAKEASRDLQEVG